MQSEKCDLLIIGSGAGAMSAALAGSVAGLDVLIVEKEPVFGGATARSAGCLWIPDNLINRAAGAVDSLEDADIYIRNEAGPRYNAARVKVFLNTGNEMLEFVQRNSPVRFGPLAGFPDYHCDTPGGSKDGRCVYPENLDGRLLGKKRALLRPVLRTSSVLGMQIGLDELGHFLGVTRSLRSFLHVTRALFGRVRDQLTAGCTQRLAAGNALIGGLAAGAFARGARLMVSTPARKLLKDGDRVTGAMVDTPAGPMRIEARRGVVIATGGFQHDSEVRARLFPSGATNAEVWGAFPYGNSGDGIRMGVEAGGVFDTDMKCPIALSPLTRLHSVEGALEVAPVLFNFKMPGVIAVTRDGRRFVNESNSYHDFGVALLDKTRGEPDAVAWVVCDHRALRRYGLGAVMPAPLPYAAHIRSGYLKRGNTPGELAEAAGIDRAGLERTIASFNAHALAGEDPEFGRGTNAFQRAGGDPTNRPNPCVAPLLKPPFYAVRVFAGSVGSFAGLKTNEHCQVVDGHGTPIEGLYAAGNDMASISGGDYIAGGITIGPAMTFGYIAARHAIAPCDETLRIRQDSVAALA